MISKKKFRGPSHDPEPDEEIDTGMHQLVNLASLMGAIVVTIIVAITISVVIGIYAFVTQEWLLSFGFCAQMIVWLPILFGVVTFLFLRR